MFIICSYKWNGYCISILARVETRNLNKEEEMQTCRITKAEFALLASETESGIYRGDTPEARLVWTRIVDAGLATPLAGGLDSIRIFPGRVEVWDRGRNNLDRSFRVRGTK